MQSIRLAIPLIVLVVLSACGEDRTERKAANDALDARDVAMVERMNRVPPQSIEPDAFSPEEIGRYGLGTMPCAFQRGDMPGLGPIFVADRDEGVMKVGEQIRRLAARSESAELPGGARTTYVGIDSWLQLERLPDDGTGADEAMFPARLVIHDAQERIVFRVDGTVRCKPKA
jgi:hypothetical protein